MLFLHYEMLNINLTVKYPNNIHYVKLTLQIYIMLN